MKKILYTATFILLVLLNSCTNTSENDLIEEQPVTLIATYNNDVKTIIDNNCTGCHNDPPVAGAPMPLLTFEQVREAVQNRDLINRISRQAGESGAMPAGGPRLPQNSIDLIIQWNDDGLLENDN